MFQGLNFPPLDLPPECEAVRAEIREFIAQEKARAEDSIGVEGMSRYAKDFSKRLGAAGFIGMIWPKKYGGQERTAMERYVVTEETLAAGLPTGTHWVADRQSGPLLLKYGTEEQRQKLLPRMAAGELCFCIGMSEPDSGSDLASIRTTATRTDGGWLLNGTKLWTSGAHVADYMIALVRTSPPSDDRHAGMSQMLVDMKAPGLEIRPIKNLAGDKHFNEEVFTDCFVPDEMVVGEVGQGWSQVMSELGYERSGPERFLSTFRLFVELVREIGPNPSQREAEVIGRLGTHLMTLRQMSLSVAGMLQAGLVPANESAIVKDLGTNYCKEVPEVARSIVAGMPSLLSDDPYERTLASSILVAPSLTIQGGTREILRGVIARGLGMR